MENTNSWISVKPKKEIIYLEKQKSPLFDGAQKSHKPTPKPGDIFRTPHVLQERVNESTSKLNPFNVGS